MKYSIVVPVYNVEKYLSTCLDSLLSQSYNDFEIIVVNDGTKDDSQKIIDKYVKKDKRIKSFIKENGGLSDARNYGSKKVTGDYIVFVDSDDSVNKDLLKEINDEVNKCNPDIIRISYQKVYEDGRDSEKIKHNTFSNYKKEEAIKMLLKDEILDMAWSYCYKTVFWNKNKFLFEKGKIHEDYGLMPYTLTKASIISSIPYIGYNYLVREGSIMTTLNKEKDYKKTMDVLDQCLINLKRINENDYSSKLIKSFYVNGVFRMSSVIPKDNRKDFYEKIKKNELVTYVMDNSLKRKIKRLMIKICLLLNIVIKF